VGALGYELAMSRGKHSGHKRPCIKPLNHCIRKQHAVRLTNIEQPASHQESHRIVPCNLKRCAGLCRYGKETGRLEPSLVPSDGPKCRPAGRGPSTRSPVGPVGMERVGATPGSSPGVPVRVSSAGGVGAGYAPEEAKDERLLARRDQGHRAGLRRLHES
jgi:hypothetical protein